jgi:hypothetical protein
MVAVSEEGLRRHAVQFYEADERMLVSNVLRYVADGLEGGEAVIVVATEPHRQAFARALNGLGLDAEAAGRAGRLNMLDADETLRRFMLREYPDAERFKKTVGALVRDAAGAAGGRVRVYGEMVGVLWSAREYPTAIRLEQLWYCLLKEIDFALFCGYPIDIFSKDFEPGIMDALLCAHSHLVPTVNDDRLTDALSRALGEVLDPKDAALLPPASAWSRAWAGLPRGESMILWLRTQFPDRADQVLGLAREYYATAT